MNSIDKIGTHLEAARSGASGTGIGGPVFDGTKVTVVFVLGGPGAGEIHEFYG